MNLKAFIIEDELKSRDTLRHLLTEFCPEVEICGEAMNVRESLPLLKELKPEVVFLDIELPGESGFSMLNHFSIVPFEIVFITAYDQYAVQAFRLSAVDYLLKPIDFMQLQEAVGKVQQKISSRQLTSLGALRENLKENNFKKIALPTSGGYLFAEIDDIVVCEANRNYTVFYMKSKEKIVVSKPLKTFESLLFDQGFYRINRSYIVNLKYVKSYFRSNNGEVMMTNGMLLSLSENRKAGFLNNMIV